MRQKDCFKSAGKGWLFAVILAVLSACGGGEQDAGSAHTAARSEGGASLPPSSKSTPDAVASATGIQSVLREGAKLNTAELEEIAKTGVLPKPFEGPLLSGAEGSTAATLNVSAEAKSLTEQKSAASRVPAYRFYNTQTGAHFYTTSTTERDNVIATLPQFNHEGAAFHVSNTTVPGLSPVHRFLNTQTGVHFYTISEAERTNVAANLPQYHYEGIGYYASTLSGTGYTPLYRFFVSAQGFHFYTNSLAERDNIIANLPQYSYEGIGYYVLGDDWQTPAVPHTGIRIVQCYVAGSNVLGVCGNLAADLNAGQDGLRTPINAMGYLPVAGQSSNDCVRDRVTGLIWEVKTAAGARAGSDTYRRTLGFAGDPTTTGAYTTAVNAMNLCGFNDWRLPTMEELHGLVNFGQTAGPRISTSNFPHTQQGAYWSGTDSGESSSQGWVVNFDESINGTDAKANAHHVRLVRGAAWVGQRYLVTSQSYALDAANNAVIDRRTGLTWRRCLEGQTWNGSACVGLDAEYTHEEAFDRVRLQNAILLGQTKWRLPNSKELVSLADRSLASPGLSKPVFDATAFPTAGDSDALWSSTPYVGNGAIAWILDSFTGGDERTVRSAPLGARLVHTNP